MTWITAGPPPEVPGFIIGARLGVGSSGSVWRATAVAGGPEVAVKVVRAGQDAERELAVLRAVAHPHVVRLHQALVLDDGRLALVLDLIDGGTLASVIAQRGHLSPGEVVTVVAPLAQTIADLHADGVQHGDLAPGNVLFDRSGRPVLADLGTPRITGEPREEVFGTAGYVDPVVLAGGPAGPSSDVYGLGALAWLALVGAPPESAALRLPLSELAPGAPAALVDAVERAVDPDPAGRPDPAALASCLYEACDPAPVWLPGAGPEVGGLTHRIRVLAAASHEATEVAGPRGHRRRHGQRQRPPARLAALVFSALAIVGVAGWWLWPGRGAHDAQLPAARPPALAASRALSAPSALSGGQAAAVVATLSTRRAALFADPRRPVTDVAVRGSPAALEDEASIRTLRARGLSYRGLELRATRVRVAESAPRRMVVDMVTAATAYDVIDQRGAAVARVAAEPARQVRLALALTAQGWRVHAVSSP